MKVSIEYGRIVFQVGNHQISLRPKSYGGYYTYFDGYEIPCRIDVVEDIVNNERADLIKKLVKMAEKFEDPKTRAKYVDDVIENGGFKTSRELTSELRKRADVKTRSSFGYRIEVGRIRGWLFVGNSHNHRWHAWLIPDDLSFVAVFYDDDVEVKKTVLKILDGDYKKFNKFLVYQGEPYILNNLKHDAEKWDIPKMREMVGMLIMMKSVAK